MSFYPKKILKRIYNNRSVSQLRLNLQSFLSKKIGIETDYNEPRLIVSLTSYPPRFPGLHLCLESLLRQTKRPNKILLWIAKDDSNQITKRVERLKKRGVEIKICPDIKSYKKIIYTIEEYPNSIIVTADDDIMYPIGWLKSLYESYKSDPNSIHCHRARLMTFNNKGELNDYRYWPNMSDERKSECVCPIGTGGVLYPPNSLHKEVLNKSNFIELCETADDIWLKAMSILNNRRCKNIRIYRRNFLEVKKTQTSSLMDTNLNGKNDTCIKDVFSAYSIYSRLKEY